MVRGATARPDRECGGFYVVSEKDVFKEPYRRPRFHPKSGIPGGKRKIGSRVDQAGGGVHARPFRSKRKRSTPLAVSLKSFAVKGCCAARFEISDSVG